jgi:8-oxo-dGTP pyrophosphatase MutT (NUDIX family)
MIIMDEKKLAWKEEGLKNIFDCRVFSIQESFCRAPNNQTGVFSIIEAADWAIVVPVLETPSGKEFLMVWQWRHGLRGISLEFPGGVFEPGENAEKAAGRELLEETGYRAGKIRKLGEFNPNPAIMSNKVHFFLAEDLEDTGRQSLDADEFLEVETVKVDSVCKDMGKPPYVHALMGTALALYLTREENERR